MKALLAAVLGLALTASQPAPRRLEIVQTIAPAQGLRSTDAARSAYLLAYFKDETHSLHFAVSADGYSFTDVNNGDPVLNGRDIAEQQGVRDPHIMRGPDGGFYLAMTATTPAEMRRLKAHFAPPGDFAVIGRK